MAVVGEIAFLVFIGTIAYFAIKQFKKDIGQ